MRSLLVIPLLLLASPDIAIAAAPAQPTLIVTIVVDQYSADLFGEYRSLYKGGLATLATGAIFPHGYQSHASTETCPGHSTILTGMRPAHTGIIANEWQGRYCVNELDDHGMPFVSPKPLLVPTLGDRLHALDSNSRTVAIGGKDRAAVVLGGKDAYLTLWWSRGEGFVTYRNATVGADLQKQIDAVNAKVKTSYESVQRPPPLPPQCKSRSRPVTLDNELQVGELHETKPKSGKWRSTPTFDALTLEVTKAAIDTLQLGKRKAVDVLAVSFSATDYVAHYFGTEGAEMCAQQIALDATIKDLLSHLDKTGISYVVALTADHGGSDIPERNSKRGVPTAQRIDPDLLPQAVGAAVAKELNLPGPIVLGTDFTNDVYLAPIDSKLRSTVLDAVRKLYEHHEQVEKVFTRNELIAAEPPRGPPDQWSLLDRAKASFHPTRSGDFVVFLKPYVTFYALPQDPDKDYYIESHGSPWDYDRRVPILFWWHGINGFEQPAAVETVDIAPTLANLIGLKLTPPEMDGRILQLGP